MVYLVGLIAAVMLAIGYVLQQHAAEEEPPSMRFSPMLLIDLMKRPLWLAGIGAMVCGQILGAIAFSLGPVALVEPLLAANLLFALPLTAMYHRRKLQAPDLIGAAILVAGLAIFVVSSHPTGGTPSAGAIGWVAALLAIAAATIVTVLFVRKVELIANVRPLAAATDKIFGQTDVSAFASAGLLATAAGMIFGLQDVITQHASFVIGHGGISALMTNWTPYLLVALAVTGLFFSQSAFSEAPLSASLPPITAVEPLVGIALGIGLYQEQVRSSPLALAGETIGLIAVVAGIIVLGRSPLVTGELHRLAEHHRAHHPHETPAGTEGDAATEGGAGTHSAVETADPPDDQ